MKSPTFVKESVCIMVIDILFFITVLLAIYKGWSKGFIVAIFSLLALIFGLAAAIKLSAETGNYLEIQTDHTSPLWPIVAFIVIFILVAFIVKILAKVLQKILHVVLLGWINRLVGILFYILAYSIIFSVLLWIGNQINFIPFEAKESSLVYGHIAAIGPEAIHDIAGWIPWFKDNFHQLEDFFGRISPIK